MTDHGSQTSDVPAAAEATERDQAEARGAAARLLTWAAFVLAAAIAFSLAFMPLRTSHDEFWHLKTGQWIVNHGALPKNDIFSYTSASLPWHNHEWLTQVIMWKLYAWGEAGKESLWGATSDFGGWGVVILAKSLLIVLAYAGFGLLLARRMKQPVWAALSAVIGAALARRTFYPRPPVVTYLLLALTLWLLIEWRAGRLRPRLLFLLLPLFALWANLHGGWLAGLIVVGAFWADAALATLLQSALRNPPSALGNSAIRNPVLLLTALGFSCALATLANPFGYHLWELPLNVMKDAYLTSCIGELKPPNFYFVWVVEGLILTLAAAALRPVRWWGFLATAFFLSGLHFLIVKVEAHLGYVPDRESLPSPAVAWVYTALALAAAGAALVRLRPPGWVAHLLIVSFFAQQGIHHVRHLTLLAVAVMPTLAWSLEAWSVAWVNTGGEDRVRRLRATAATAAGFCSLVVLGGWWMLGWGLWLVTPNPASGTPAPNRWLLRETPPQIVHNWALLRGMELLPGAYPVRAVDFLERARLPGRLWNGGNYAGYLIWRLSPEKYQTFTDNRYDIYGGSFIRQEHSVTEGWTQAELDEALKENPNVFNGPPPPPWAAVLDQWGVQTVFIEHGARGNNRLAQGGWVRVWEDYDFNIWVRDTPQNKDAIARALALTRR